MYRRAVFAILFLTISASRLLAVESAHFDEHWIASEVPSLRLYLRHLPPRDDAQPQASSPMLFLHGATFPSGTAAGYRFDGYSWMDNLSRRGFDVWALDYRNEDADWLFRHLTSAELKRDVLISKGAHVMQIESGRFQLYAEVATFLGGEATVD